ncbi:ABC transporter substrate-binding protein [Pseudomonas sp. R5(2019)]|uniref:ABC transporter substrate-binding protein n=1 Tax=Pseudomonas sp. R5(2019) TaxID=2697566 RepID=UPI001412A6E9|nr:ABC transporter substrate-binding protein [Pseudomonas sp. R5(2019)]NBA97345.1 ABC transporter substrate-binding protein [Pseudomonas sp. R5(2019)]
MLCLLLLAPLQAAEILLTGQHDSAGIQAFTGELAQRRPHDNVRFVALQKLPGVDRIGADTRLILLDPASLDWRLQGKQGPPTLVLRISRIQAQQQLGSQHPARLSLLWSDPPLSRQLQLIRRVMPQAQQVGVLYDQHSAFLLDELRQAAGPMRLEIVAQAWPNTSDGRPLRTVLKQSDVLLGLDDPDLYNSKTVKNILLSAYARQIPLIGPNAAFVKAGSLLSSYSDQADWLAVLDELLDRPPASWPRAHYPDHFKVTSNRQVARSLGLEPIDDASLATDLAEGANTP